MSHTQPSSLFLPHRLILGIFRLTSLVAVIGTLVIGSMFWWTMSREASLRAEVHELQLRLVEEIAIRDASIARLSKERRLARIEVLEPLNEVSTEGQAPATTLRFIEIDEEGRELGRRTFTVPGDTIYFDAWTARFPPEAVAKGDHLRGQTLVLFKRIYSDLLAPSDGVSIDTPGGVPDGYAGSKIARFEQGIWSNFWRIATNPEESRARGIRVAQGEAVYSPMKPGDVYELKVDALGGMTLTPQERIIAASQE